VEYSGPLVRSGGMGGLPRAGHEFAFHAPVNAGALEGVVGRVAGKAEPLRRSSRQGVGLQVGDVEAFANGRMPPSQV